MPAQEAYVPGHTHDLFVSYAWVDDRIPGKTRPEGGWVRTLVDSLRDLLATQLGRGDRGDIWIDRRIDPTQDITPEVQQALDGSALLLVVLSQGWLESPWCQHELERFVQRPDAGAKGRTFVIHKTAIEPAQRPEPIRELIGYDLYQTNRDGRERQLGFPVPLPDSPEDREYFNRLDDLSRDLGRRLKELRSATGAPPPKAPVPPTLAAPKDANTKAIYLAEVSRDLRDRRLTLCRQLDQSGYATLPARVLPANPADYRRAAEAELARSLLFVQLLGPYTTDKRPDLPQGYEALQLELAQGCGLPILRWMDPTQDQGQIDDPGLFGQAPVIVCAFDDFKRRVEQHAGRLLLPAPILPDTDTQVLIRAAAADEASAYGVGERLLAKGVGYEVADETPPLADLVQQAPYQGLMVVYDRCDRDWARQQVNECRVIAMARKDKAPACAVFDAPWEGKRRLGIAVPRFHWLSGLEDPDLDDFVHALAAVALP